MRKKDAFDAKIVNTRLTKIFIAIFAPDERLPSTATLHYGEDDGDDDVCHCLFYTNLSSVVRKLSTAAKAFLPHRSGGRRLGWPSGKLKQIFCRLFVHPSFFHRECVTLPFQCLPSPGCIRDLLSTRPTSSTQQGTLTSRTTDTWTHTNINR